jgi:hypothetical protein
MQCRGRASAHDVVLRCANTWFWLSADMHTSTCARFTNRTSSVRALLTCGLLTRLTSRMLCAVCIANAVHVELSFVCAVRIDHQRLMMSVVKRPRMKTTMVARLNTAPAAQTRSERRCVDAQLHGLTTAPADTAGGSLLR